MDLHFGCTQCGACCHNLKLPLTIDEAMAWAGRGDAVQLLCEASAAFDEPDVGSSARYRHDRSFPAMSGTVPIRVSVTLAASFAGPCPHLQADMRCGIYEERPLVCRIYPAEISPNLDVGASQKACPPEAWSTDEPLLLQAGAVVDHGLRSDIEAFRSAVLADVPARSRLCGRLDVSEAAFSNEGFSVASPAPGDLVDVLALARLDAPEPGPRQWTIVTNRNTTYKMLDTVEADAVLVGNGPDYIGFFADEPVVDA